MKFKKKLKSNKFSCTNTTSTTFI